VVAQRDLPAIGGPLARHAFGRVVHMGDVNGYRPADVAAAAPGENAGAGAVCSLRSREEYAVSPGGVPLPATVSAPRGPFTFGHTLLGTTAAKARLGSGFAN
jgi:hypothetical protein